METKFVKGMLAGMMAVLAVAAVAFAVVPATFNYQGYLKNSDGTPVTTATAIKFTLYSSASGAAPLWTESRSVTPANGTYSIQLGATQPLNLPFDRRYYLGVTVGDDPEMRPLQQLDSVPYALRAAVSDSTGPHSHSGGDITAGTVADARLSANVGLLGTAQTVTGLKTFAPASGSVPFAVGSNMTGVVTNLNAEMLEGKRITDLNGIYAPAILSRATIQQIATQTWNLTTSGAYLPGASNPFDMAFDGANIWVPGTVGVKKVRASDGAMLGDYATGTLPYGVAFDGQHVWISNTGSNNLTKRVAANGASAGTFSLGAGAEPKGIAFDGTSLWVANSGNNTVSKVDLNGNVLGTFAAGTTPMDVVSDGTNIWVANRGSNNVSKLSKTGAPLGTYPVGTEPINLVFDGSYVWTANYGNKTVSRIKITDGAIQSFPVPAANPMGLAFDGSHVWVGDYYGSKVCIVRASDGVLVGTVQVDDNPQGLLFDGDNVWSAMYLGSLVKLPAPAFTMTLSAGALNSGAVTTEKVADGAVTAVKMAAGSVTAAKLNIDDNIRLNDKNLYLRGGSDTNHGLGWHGSTKTFGGSTLDGPALYGYSGGVLGTTSGGEKIALSWDVNKNVTFGSHLYLNGILNLDTAAKIQANGRDLYVGWDELHGLGWYGTNKNFSSTNVNGPVLYGFAGGALGTTNGGQKIALSWDSNKNVTAAANLTVAGSQTVTGSQTLAGNLSLSGSLNLDSSTAKIQLKDKDLYISYDALHGLGWYGAGKYFVGTENVNGPVLYGNGGGALGSAADGTTRKIAFQWYTDGNSRLHDNTLYLRANGGDSSHGIGWFNNGLKAFKGNTTDTYDGPILFGLTGGALGTTNTPTGKLVLKWSSSGAVTIPGSLSKGSGSFKIDHPLDPTGKYLYHSFVESPDMMNIYNGVTVTDERGYATVMLPDWFQALNRDFRYQLTVIDESDSADFVQTKVVKGVSGNRFTIRSSSPLTKISWQVTGIRKDPYAEAHRVPVEEAKPASEQGSCLHQEACR